MKNLIKTKEEVKLFYRKIDLIMEKAFYTIAKTFSKDKTSLERLKKMKAYHDYITKLTDRRLSPQGKPGGIMLIGTNPSNTSSLKDIWDDTYGKFLKECLIEAEIDPNEVWVTNLYKLPTEGNRPLNEHEIKLGLEELILEIGFVEPTSAVVLGKLTQAAIGSSSDKWPKECLLYRAPHPTWIKSYAPPEERSKFISLLKEVKKQHEKTRMGKADDSRK